MREAQILFLYVTNSLMVKIMNDNVKHILESSAISLKVSHDKNDKDSIYIVDLVGYLLGIEEARENILEFCKRQENKTQEIENNIPKMLETIDRYFRGNKNEY